MKSRRGAARRGAARREEGAGEHQQEDDYVNGDGDGGGFEGGERYEREGNSTPVESRLPSVNGLPNNRRVAPRRPLAHLRPSAELKLDQTFDRSADKCIRNPRVARSRRVRRTVPFTRI